MTLNKEYVTVLLGGIIWNGWESMSVRASLKEAARSFELTTSERPGQWIAPPGTPIQIFANKDLLLDGYVNEYKPRVAAVEHLVTLSGRGKGQDCIDCAAVHDTGYFEKQTPAEIGQSLDHFGVGIRAGTALEKIDYFQIYQGETVFQAVERASRAQGKTLMGRADGGIEITDATAAGRHAGYLAEGYNMKVADATLSDQNRHSEHIVKGQRRHGTSDADLHVEEKINDVGVNRYRPKMVINEGDTDAQRARVRAQHEANRSQGFSVRAEIETQGFRDEGGQIFTPNNLQYVESLSLKILGDMLIENVVLTQDNSGGSLAKLSLVNAKAYNGDGGSNQSDAAWG